MDLLDTGETKADYQKQVRKINELPSGRKRKILPPYYKLQDEKTAAGPKPDDIWVTDWDVGIPMQKCLDLTVKRTLLNQKLKNRIRQLKEKNGRIRVQNIFKFGRSVNS